ncbi:MAG TPA: hypothetical protein VGL78_16720 [Solirubrobacteraceae bacterium]|jgi:hypothetical protein
MYSTTHAVRQRGHLSRRERLQLARAEAFSRRTGVDPLGLPPVKLSGNELEVIDRLVRRDRTAVSSALLAVAGIGSGEPMRRAVLASVNEAAYRARAEGVIGERRSEQIARHVRLVVERSAASRSWSLAA